MKLLYIARYPALAALLLLLLALAPARAQDAVYQGETTPLTVNQKPGDTYEWELYNDSINDFNDKPGNCPVALANFVGGNTGVSVNVKWYKAGVYFYKVTARDVSGCTDNLKIGKVVVKEALPTAAFALPDPDWLCIGQTVSLVINLTGRSPWDVTFTDGTNVETVKGITEAKYLLKVHPKAPTQYWITQVKNATGINSIPSQKVWLIVYMKPESSNIYLYERK